jgi:hypothetical protein
MAHGTVEIAVALDATIVLPCVLLEFDSNPLTGSELGGSNKPNDAIAAVIEPDSLPDS